MRDTKLPNPFQFDSGQKYFSEFIRINEKQEGFSIRSVSLKLDWPVSYISDILAERKPLSISRASQFGVYFSLSPVDMEKLIFIAMKDSGYLSQDAVRSMYIPTDEPESQFPQKEDVNVEYILLLDVIHWLKERATFEKISYLLNLKGIAEERVRFLLAELKEKKYLTQDQGVFRAESYNILSFANENQTPACDTKSFLQMQIRSMRPVMPRPYFFHSSFVHIHSSREVEMRSKMRAFMNWIQEISKLDAELPVQEDVRLFQFDLNLISVFGGKDRQR